MRHGGYASWPCSHVLAASLAAIAAAYAHPAQHAALTASCAKSSLRPSPRTLTVGTDNPAYPPWYAGGTPKGSPWKINDPDTGKGFEPAVAYAVAKKLGFSHSQVKWVYIPFNRSFAPGSKSFDFDINQISYTPARAKVVTFSTSYYDVNQALVVLAGTPISKVHSVAGLKPFKLGAQLGTTSYSYITNVIKPSKQPSVFPQNAARDRGAEEQADRRPRRRPADRLLRHGRPGAPLEDPRPVPDRLGRRALRDGLRQGQSACHLRRHGPRFAEADRHACEDPEPVASEGDRRADLEVEPAPRNSKILSGLGRRRRPPAAC